MGIAADRYATVTRGQWANYKRYGIPVENQLIGMIDNKQNLNSNLASAQGLINTESNVAASETNRMLGQYGVTQDAAQIRTNNRLNNLSRTASLASARDFVRQDQLDLGQTIINGAPNSGLNVV